MPNRRNPVRLLVAVFFSSLLFVAGCEKGAEVDATFPADGQQNVTQSVAKIDITFSTEVDSATATDLSNYDIVGSQSGPVASADFTAVLGEAMADAIAGIPGLNVTAEENARTVTLRPGTGSTFNFSLGETVTVYVRSGVTSANGTRIQSDEFTFVVQVTQAAAPILLGTPQVVGAPAVNGLEARPTMVIEFSDPVDSSTLTTSNIF
ncbi:MAG: hypothetical protein AAF581_22435, partial [Planctomycetota bacterium]